MFLCDIYAGITLHFFCDMYKLELLNVTGTDIFSSCSIRWQSTIH